MSNSPQFQQSEEMEGVVGTEEKKEEDNDIISKFREKMVELNISFANSLEKAVLGNPTQCLIPLCMDYLQYQRALLEDNSAPDGSSSPKTWESLGAFWGDFEKSLLAEMELFDGADEPEQPELTPKRKMDVDEDNDVKTSSATASSPEPSVKKFAASPDSKPFADFSFDQRENGTVQIVQETDSLYSTKCKIFEVVKGGFPNLRGVGMLYLKKLTGNRYQVLVRADNSQGKVLLNIPVQKSLPIAMKGKDAIATVDVTPCEAGKPAMPIVIKTANWADANKLFEKLMEFQQA